MENLKNDFAEHARKFIKDESLLGKLLELTDSFQQESLVWAKENEKRVNNFLTVVRELLGDSLYQEIFEIEPGKYLKLTED
jgi:hypothetical protein